MLESQELSRVLWGGLTQGSLTLLSGEPGIGKSTLSLQIADWFARDGRSTLYISAEENFTHLSSRSKRMNIANKEIFFAQTSSLEASIDLIIQNPSQFIIIDSISLMSSDSDLWAISSLKLASESYMKLAKSTGKSILLIGHVTKDGSISGPKMMEHLVDTVLFLEGEKWENYRILRAFKNRFGPTDEIALFRMEEDGLHDIVNAGMEFINLSHQDPGSIISMTIEWTRPLLIEVESLVTSTKFGYPKRSARGINTSKLDLIIATLIKHAKISLDSSDVYANIARGLTLPDPGIDVAIAAAILSSKTNSVFRDVVWLGEVSLTGRLKAPHLLRKRIEEAKKLGMKKIFAPITKDLQNIEGVTNIEHIRDILPYFSKHREMDDEE